MKNKSKSKHSFVSFLMLIFFIGFMVVTVSQIIQIQADIAEKRTAIDKLNADIIEMRQENDEYQRILNTTDEEQYMFTVAVEKLGYAYPRERRFYPKPK